MPIKRINNFLFLVILGAFIMSTLQLKAGGLMTNTNYHISFDRMMARGATFDIDAAYSNPAGLAWIDVCGYRYSESIGRSVEYNGYAERTVPLQYECAI